MSRDLSPTFCQRLGMCAVGVGPSNPANTMFDSLQLPSPVLWSQHETLNIDRMGVMQTPWLRHLTCVSPRPPWSNLTLCSLPGYCSIVECEFSSTKKWLDPNTYLESMLMNVVSKPIVSPVKDVCQRHISNMHELFQFPLTYLMNSSTSEVSSSTLFPWKNGVSGRHSRPAIQHSFVIVSLE